MCGCCHLITTWLVVCQLLHYMSHMARTCFCATADHSSATCDSWYHDKEHALLRQLCHDKYHISCTLHSVMHFGISYHLSYSF